MSDRLTDEEIEGLADRLENPGSGSAHNYMERGKLAARILRRLLAERRWLPISEAPTDDWIVLWVVDVGELVGKYKQDPESWNEGWMIPSGSGPIFVEATHWRPRLTPREVWARNDPHISSASMTIFGDKT